jgi:hypothetical protein
LNVLARSSELGRHTIHRFHFPRDAERDTPSWRREPRASEGPVVW